MEAALNLLKALSEPTRLRLLLLCNKSDLTVSDLTNILSQSQPRLSRHLKILVEAGALRRLAEGQHVYFARNRETPFDGIVQALIDDVAGSSAGLRADEERLAATLEARAKLAQGYFNKHAAKWNEVRGDYNDDGQAERAFIEELASSQSGKVASFLDMGTGTGRILQQAARYVDHGVGIDTNREMLTIARSRLTGPVYRHLVVQEGNIYALPFEPNQFEAVGLYQVLHFLDDPSRAIKEAGRVLRRDGRLLVVDYARHEREELQRNHAHLWLGFTQDEMEAWFTMAKLKPVARRVVADTKPHPGGGVAPKACLWVAQKLS